MRAPSRLSLPPGIRLGIALGLLAACAPSRADPLLTHVSYVDGAASYSLFDAASPGGPGLFFNSLHPGMSVPPSSHIQLADDARVVLSPIPAIRYMLMPGAKITNDQVDLHATLGSGQALDCRVRVLLGTLVGDIDGPLRGVDNQIGTPRAEVRISSGHFLVTVKPDGSSKYAVLRGVMVVHVSGDDARDYHVTASQELTLQAHSAKLQRLGDAAPDPGAGGPEKVNMGTAGEALPTLGSLAGDPEAMALLNEPFPADNGDQIASVPQLLAPSLLPGQSPFDYNPANLPQINPANTPDNPMISPILP